MTGEKKFQHLILKRQVFSTQYNPSDHLMIDVDNAAREFLEEESQLRLTQRDITKDVGEAARIRIYKHNRNQLGDINLQSGLVNNEEQLRKMGGKVLLVLLLKN